MLFTSLSIQRMLIYLKVTQDTSYLGRSNYFNSDSCFMKILLVFTRRLVHTKTAQFLHILTRNIPCSSLINAIFIIYAYTASIVFVYFASIIFLRTFKVAVSWSFSNVNGSSIRMISFARSIGRSLLFIFFISCCTRI